MNFNYYQPTELIVGAKKVEQLANVVIRYGYKILLVGPTMNASIQPMFDRVLADLRRHNIEVISFLEVEPNPSSTTVEKGLKLAQNHQVNAIVAMGGGSSIDTAKLIGLCIDCPSINWPEMFSKYSQFTKRYTKISKTKLPVIAIPTTAGTGSQCTQASVITDDVTKMKCTIFHQENYATVAIIDPELTLSLPTSITVSTAFDAFTHAFESYLRNEGNPITEHFSLQAISNIVEYLPKVLRENNVKYREILALSDTMAGIALANNGAALPHPLSEIIGSYVTGLSHGQALALVYPTFIKHTYEKYEHKFAKVCRLFDPSYKLKSDIEAARDFHVVLSQFQKENGLEFNLRQYVKDQEALDAIKNFEVWQVLPMEKTEIILNIVNELCNQ